MEYTIDDLKQAIIGAFIAIIVFFAIRGGSPFYFNPTTGLIITGVLLWIYYNGFQMKYKMTHYVINLVVSFAVCAIMALQFGLVNKDIIFTYDVLGSLVAIGVWVSFPATLIFDRYNFTNPLKRWYVRGH